MFSHVLCLDFGCIGDNNLRSLLFTEFCGLSIKANQSDWPNESYVEKLFAKMTYVGQLNSYNCECRPTPYYLLVIVAVRVRFSLGCLC